MSCPRAPPTDGTQHNSEKYILHIRPSAFYKWKRSYYPKIITESLNCVHASKHNKTSNQPIRNKLPASSLGQNKCVMLQLILNMSQLDF